MIQAIQRFLRYLVVERNAAEHTIKSYREDMLALQEYLEESEGRIPAPAQITTFDLRGYVAAMHDAATGVVAAALLVGGALRAGFALRVAARVVDDAVGRVLDGHALEVRPAGLQERVVARHPADAQTAGPAADPDAD